MVISGCGVQIKNERWYGDLGQNGAVYFETLTTATGSVPKPEWDAMRVGMACTSTDTLSDIKREIEQLCSATSCDYEKVHSVLKKFQANLERLK